MKKTFNYQITTFFGNDAHERAKKEISLLLEKGVAAVAKNTDGGVGIYINQHDVSKVNL